MKRFIFSAALAVFFVVVSIETDARGDNSASGISEASVNIRDLGHITDDVGSITVLFAWTNHSASAVKIDRIVRGCQCTEITPDRKVVGPNETVSLKAVANSRAWKGDFKTQFVMFFEDPNLSPVAFTLKGYRELPIEADPPSVDFGSIDKLNTASREFRIVWVAENSSEAISIENAILVKNHLAKCMMSGQLEKAEPTSPTDKIKFAQEFTFTVTPSEQLSTGKFSDQIIIPIKQGSRHRTLVVPVTGELLAALIPRPSEVVTAIPRGKINDAKMTINLSRRDSSISPAKITATIDNPFLIVSCFADQNDLDNAGRAEISIRANTPTGTLTGNVQLVADFSSGQRSSLTVPVKIEILADP